MTEPFGRRKDPILRSFGKSEYGRTGTPPSQQAAMREAATRLVHRAMDALLRQETDRAADYVRKGARLSYDDGGAAPLAVAAHMYALRAVLDAHEAGDGVWIDAANNVLDPMSTRNPLALADFRHALTVVQHDYGTTPAEERNLRALTEGQHVATIREMQELEGEELSAVVIDLLEIVHHYDDAVGMICDERGIDHY
ncbi:hypothetical protein [Flexivirga alba]|uniref:DUF4254 domain-containing protein n=1 Tax=Flexivirga alba TaxID=702742 RepID=A0ABW2AKR2_9MICO